ncbi:hypothetical protein CJE1672 [Campylobacter jejuni RM1221]|nr:hypothetical protein CJE1672 [Campylobacter jejuni RM1221]
MIIIAIFNEKQNKFINILFDFILNLSYNLTLF